MTDGTDAWSGLRRLVSIRLQPRDKLSQIVCGQTLVAVGALVAFTRWEEWANLSLGVWAVLAPWLLGFVGVAYATYAHAIIGLVVALLAAVELWMVSKRSVSTT